jgi:hypothetical protein
MIRAILNSHAVWLTPMSLKAFLFQLKDFSSIVDAKIMISGKVEAMIPDIPAMRISFWTFVLIF